MIRRALVAGMLAVASEGLLACRHHARAAPVTTASQDSLRGIVSITGTSFEQQVMLRVDSRMEKLVASVADSTSLARVGGTEVVVRGRAAANGFRVASFTVRSVDGAPVADGILVRASGGLVLESSNGTLVFGRLPAALDTLVGARVWISGPRTTGPNSYGLITPVP